MKRHSILLSLVIFCAFKIMAADPMATDYSYAQCQGSLMPYPNNIKSVACPDSLTSVFINHVGRHGARFPASDKHTIAMRDALNQAAEQGSITPLGRELLNITDLIISESKNRWGALDSLGEYEQRMIASRLLANFKPVFDKAHVHAISSYSPRCMMSMYCFTHQLDRLNNHIEFTTSTGRDNSKLMRPFDLDEDYKELRKSDKLTSVYDGYFTSQCPTTAIERVLGKDYQYADDAQKQDLAITEYYVLASLSAMMVDCDLSRFFTSQEINALWSCFNLRQYLQHTASTVSILPADIAGYLLLDLINTIDDYINNVSDVNVQLRFGHAETLMPLLSLMKLTGCYYLTNYFDTVAKHWQDFNVVPMAANLQMILLKHNTKGTYYLRVDLNEVPMPLIPNSKELYIPWDRAKEYLTKCVPIYMM